VEKRILHLLRAGDLLVVNDSGVLPASVPARTVLGEAVELRALAAPHGRHHLRVTALGRGDYRIPTEAREPPPPFHVGEHLSFGDGASTATIVEVDPRFRAVLTLHTVSPALELLYALGTTVQYAHVPTRLQLWDVQTPFAGLPWSVEAPSASFALNHSMLRNLRQCGVTVLSLTHAAGLSATGDPLLDAVLPLPERSFIPEALVDAIRVTKAAGGRVVAVGTTVVRALEGAAHTLGTLRNADFINAYRLSNKTTLQVVDAILTGVHEAETSHFRLLEAFTDAKQLHAALEASSGFLSHEFGDAWFVSTR
jgi:S-adenosylmethionine:tRNA ribosyltransferase-isomerase